MTTKAEPTSYAISLAANINEVLASGGRVIIRNHLKAVRLTKKHVGAVTASGNGIRIYGGPFWPVGSFSASKE